MNHHIVPPLITAFFTGLALPSLLARARWVRLAPRLAVATWGFLAATFTGAVATGVLTLLLPYDDAHRMVRRVAGCVPGDGQGCHPGPQGTADLVALIASAAVLALPTGALFRELLKARRRRARHAQGLRMIGRRDAGLRATVVPHPEPMVYCLPGHAAQIVVTTGALHILTDAQLAAALRHERAHIAGRHHVMIGACEAFGRVFRGLPLTRRARSEVPLLLEMAADDHALRHCTRDVLATALYSMATARMTDRAALAAGGPSTAIRIARILDGRRGGHPALACLMAVGGTAMALMPLATTCCFILP